MDLQDTRVALIFNPIGGSAKSGVVNALTDELESRGADVTELTTTPEPGSATKLAAQAAKDGFHLVVAIGGDGTAAAVAQGLVGKTVPMSVFPGGTANLFATYHQIRKDVAAFGEMIAEYRPRPIDLLQVDYTTEAGKTGTHYVLVALGLGPISDAISNADPDMKKRFRETAYVGGVTIACLNPKPEVMEIVHGTRTVWDKPLSALFVLNSPPTKMPAIAPGCTDNDGYFDAVLIGGSNVLNMAHVFAAIQIGRPNSSKHYSSFQSREIVIRLQRDMVPNLDGDAGTPACTFELKVLGDAVQMVLPPQPESGGTRQFQKVFKSFAGRS